MPIIALTPAARSPLVAPGFIRLGPRPLRVRGLLAARVSSHGEGMCGAGVGFELTAHVPCLRIAQHAASGPES
eukprot:4615449-Pleurochrysis_carterae.AAC.1